MANCAEVAERELAAFRKYCKAVKTKEYTCYYCGTKSIPDKICKQCGGNRVTVKSDQT